MSEREKYTVGWICAITKEVVAARAFLDESHPDLDFLLPGDMNNYVLGKMGHHNVVIVQLPEGEYGIGSAATVAKDMVHAFPNIQIGLMVGVGGGAPSLNNDIRLGDVVVSLASHGMGGVFQYDFGKAVQNQGFQSTGFLNQPPTILRTAVSRLKADHELHGQCLAAKIDSVLEKNPLLKQRYAKPSEESDKLYRSDFVHPSAGVLYCRGLCDAKTSNWIERPPRAGPLNNPVIHYGIIASANQVMKDALIRDQLARDKGVLCFEMEAAGLMNHFPCLVVRGICDYADSHKSKEWQGYAAMASTAYAKDLLSRVLPIKRDVSKGDVMKLDTPRQDFKGKGLIEWLQPCDPLFNQKRALKQRCSGTCDWVFDNQSYRKWHDSKIPCLWICGVSGSGKTVLCSRIIEQLGVNVGDRRLLYFYFDFSDAQKQRTDTMLRTFLYRLYVQHAELRGSIMQLYTDRGGGYFQPSSEELTALLLQLLTELDQVWIVLDAVDECSTREDSDDPGLLSLIQRLVSTLSSKCHLLIVSQPLYDISTYFDSLSCVKEKIHLAGEHVTADVQLYVRDRLQHDTQLQRWKARPDIQSEIYSGVVESHDTIFRSVACRLDDVGSCLKPNEVRSKLAAPPTSLGAAYNRILRRVPNDYHSSAIRILQLLLYAPGGISVSEAVDAIVVNVSAEPAFQKADRMPNYQEIAMYCSSLVTMTTVDNKANVTARLHPGPSESNSNLILQLAHSSVQHHLLSEAVEPSFKSALTEQSAMADLAELCLSYLVCIDRRLEAKKIEEEFPFARFCVQNWIRYTFSAGKNHANLQKLMSRLLGSSANSDHVNLSELYRVGSLSLQDNHRRTSDRQPDDLYYASQEGSWHLVKQLLNKGFDPNKECGRYGNALIAASASGHTKVIQILLDSKAKLDSQNKDDETALIVSSLAGHTDVVVILLRFGASSDFMSRHHGTALMAAAQNGHVTIIESLLSFGADINTRSPQHGTALSVASAAGHKSIVIKLLAAGADMNIKGGLYGNPMSAASYNRHPEIQQLLGDWKVRKRSTSNFGSLALNEMHSQDLENLDEAWISIEIGCRQVSLGQSDGINMKAYMRLYVEIHNYATSRNHRIARRAGTLASPLHPHLLGGQLYRRLSNFVDNCVEDIYRRSGHRTSEEFLRFYVREWHIFYQASEYFNHCFKYLNRHYIKRVRDEGKKNIYDVFTLQMRAWRTGFQMKVRTKLRESIVESTEPRFIAKEIYKDLIPEVARCLLSHDLSMTESDETTRTLNGFNEFFAKPLLKGYKDLVQE